MANKPPKRKLENKKPPVDEEILCTECEETEENCTCDEFHAPEEDTAEQKNVLIHFLAAYTCPHCGEEIKDDAAPKDGYILEPKNKFRVEIQEEEAECDVCEKPVKRPRVLLKAL